MAEPRLTLLIITYNRSHLIKGQLRRLRGMLCEVAPDLVELVVSDNFSQDDTAAEVPPLLGTFPNARFIRQPRHEWSSENHVRAAVDECRGDFIWIMSDDDLVDPAALSTVVALLKDRQPAFIFLNPAVFDIGARILLKPNGWLTPYDVCSSGDPVVITYEGLILRTGLVSAIANYSCTIANRNLLCAADWHTYYDINPVGALIPAFLDAFRMEPGFVVMRPLVHLTLSPSRLNENSLDNDYYKFFRFGSAIKQPAHYWWFLYPALFIQAAIRHNAFPAGRFIDIIEITLDGRRDRLAHSVLAATCSQMIYAIDRGDLHQNVTETHLNSIRALFPAVAFGMSYAALFRELSSHSRDIHEALRGTAVGRENKLQDIRKSIEEIRGAIRVDSGTPSSADDYRPVGAE